MTLRLAGAIELLGKFRGGESAYVAATVLPSSQKQTNTAVVDRFG
jgi:hypothetical protein